MSTTRPSNNGPNVAQSIVGLTHDTIELAELQARLLKLDAQIATRKGGKSAVLAVVSASLLVGSVPVALLGLAELFVVQFEWPRYGSIAASTTIGLALSAVSAWGAWRYVSAALASLQRSRDELNRNLAWLKDNLKRDNSSATTT